MKLFVFGMGALVAGLTMLPQAPAEAADMPAYRHVQREALYRRPIPRVYYQSARPTMVCRVAFVDDRRNPWPKERDAAARCTRLD